MLERGKEGSHGTCVRRVEKKESLFQTNIIKEKKQITESARKPLRTKMGTELGNATNRPFFITIS